MDIVIAKSYKQNIKSKSRQSETLVIQKKDFFELIDSFINQGRLESGETGGGTVSHFTDQELKDIEHCIQLTPKIPYLYAIRHIETLF